jgi:hypothetical protein
VVVQSETVARATFHRLFGWTVNRFGHSMQFREKQFMVNHYENSRARSTDVGNLIVLSWPLQCCEPHTTLLSSFRNKEKPFSI